MGGHGRDHWHVGTSSQDGRGGQGTGNGAGRDGDQQQPTSSPEQPMEQHEPGAQRADADDPIDDLSAMQADDVLLDALGGTDPDLSGQDRGADWADQELTSLLLSWRREADSEPMAELVDTDAAMSVIASSKARTGRRRHRFLVPVATAAAVLSIAFTGVGLAAKSAQPGDTLWGLTKVLYAEHAASVEAAGTVQSDLDEVEQALREGDFDRARELLDKARKALGEVQNEDGKNSLQEKHQDLKTEVEGAAVPPVGPGSSSSSSSAIAPPPGSSSGQDEGSGSGTPPASSPQQPPPEDSSDTTTPPDGTTSPDDPTSPSTPSTPSAGIGGQGGAAGEGDSAAPFEEPVN